MSNRRFVIKVRYGGLGDHLFWSHLPRIAKTVGGYKQVYISNLSEYRHPDYRKLVWELNPFVDGFCDEDGPYPEFLAFPVGFNLLDRIMLYRGLDDGKRFHEPEVFYHPNNVLELSIARVFDPNYVSFVGEISNRKLIRHLNDSGGMDFKMCVRGRSFGGRQAVPILHSSDIFQYCDIIASCKSFLCLNSGGATLAAALGKPATVFYGVGQKREFRHSAIHHYVDVSSTISKLMWKIFPKYHQIREFTAKLWHSSLRIAPLAGEAHGLRKMGLE